MDFLLEHIKITLNHCGDNSLYETRGVCDGVDDVSDWLSKELWDSSKNINDYFVKNGRGSVYKLKFNKKNLKVNDAFIIRNLNLTCLFKFDITADNNAKTNTNEFKDFFDIILRRHSYDVDIVCEVSGTNIRAMINATLFDLDHELMHAYQNNELKRKGMTLSQMAKFHNYSKKSIVKKTDDDIMKEVKDFLYATDVFERGAFIAQTKRELKIIGINCKTAKEFKNAVKLTEMYSIYQKLEKTILTIKYCYSKYLDGDTLIDYEGLLKRYFQCFNEVSEKKVNTIEQFVNKMIFIFDRYSRKYITTIDKIIVDIIDVQKGRTQIRKN